MTALKEWLRPRLSAAVTQLGRTHGGRWLMNQVLEGAMSQTRKVLHQGIELSFITPNPLCDWRAETFSTKEPETLAWIDSLPEQAVLWDVGANVGLYALYAARRRNCTVWAFEPSVFNLELLARNVHINDLADKVFIMPLALSDRLGPAPMRLTTTTWGGALSTFGQDFGWDGQPIRAVLEYTTVGLSMEDAVNRLGATMPTHIKMDVDGLEHFILRGGKTILQQVQGVLIEVNDDFEHQASECRDLLHTAGLHLLEKRHSDLIAGSKGGFANSYNQIWARQGASEP